MLEHDRPISRRDFTRVGALGTAGLVLDRTLPAQAQQIPHAQLRSEFLLDMVLDVGTAQDLGPRRIVPITGGAFQGPRLRGVALDGGGDWSIRRPDGASELNVRATLRTDDEQLIYIWYRGLLYRIGDTDENYWRTTPVFETASEKYHWLTRIITVGVARPVPGKAAFSVYQIL